MSALVLIRYGELALKSAPVRREFEATLRRNIVAQFAGDGLDLRLRSDRGHLYAEADDAERAVRTLRRVFGVTSVSPVSEIPTDRDVIQKTVLALVDPRLVPGSTFAVRVRRTGVHSFTSQELARDLGSAILDRFGDRQLVVDLDEPKVEVFVEVRDNRTYVFFDRVAGPGGVPLGVAGSIVARVDGARGAFGAYLMMKRGCRVAVVVTPAGLSARAESLQRFDPKLRFLPVPTEGAEAEAALQKVVEEVRADAVVLPLAVDDYPAARDAWGDRVVFSPTVGLSDDEVATRWERVVQIAEETPGGRRG